MAFGGFELKKGKKKTYEREKRYLSWLETRRSVGWDCFWGVCGMGGGGWSGGVGGRGRGIARGTTRGEIKGQEIREIKKVINIRCAGVRLWIMHGRTIEGRTEATKGGVVCEWGRWDGSLLCSKGRCKHRSVDAASGPQVRATQDAAAAASQ